MVSAVFVVLHVTIPLTLGPSLIGSFLGHVLQVAGTGAHVFPERNAGRPGVRAGRDRTLHRNEDDVPAICDISRGLLCGSPADRVSAMPSRESRRHISGFGVDFAVTRRSVLGGDLETGGARSKRFGAAGEIHGRDDVSKRNVRAWAAYRAFSVVATGHGMEARAAGRARDFHRVLCSADGVERTSPSEERGTWRGAEAGH